ncbi:MAG: diguanylate cyclase [Eggerthellaceae bacterium]|nr:diguanylate cyclase [Eggerthellaceae bacterium]
MSASTRSYRIRAQAIVVVLVACVLTILSLLASSEYIHDADVESVQTSFARGWIDEDGNLVDLSMLGAADLSDGDNVILHNTLPSQLDPGDDLVFCSCNTNFIVYVNGEEVYSFQPERSPLVGHNYGYAFHFIDLPRSVAGTEVVIYVNGMYADNSSEFKAMEICSANDYIHRHFLRGVPLGAVCLAVVFLGSVLIGMHFYLRNIGRIAFNLASLGLFSVIVGVWATMHTLIPYLLAGGIQLWRVIDCYSLIFAPYLLVAFADSLMVKRRKRYVWASFSVAMALAIAAFVLNLADILDIHYTMHAVRVVMLLQAALAIYMIASTVRLQRSAGHYVRHGSVINALVVFITASFVDLVAYMYVRFSFYTPGMFASLGLLAALLIVYMHIGKIVKSDAVSASQIDEIRNLAVTDALTGIGNVRAWNDAKEELQSMFESGQLEDAAVCMLDVNNLKHVNDTLGHEAGDRYICVAADYLNRTFGKFGGCYRKGGDEFTAVICTSDPAADFHECLVGLNELLDEFNAGEGAALPMRIAVGSASVKEHGSFEVAEIVADESMYAHKSSMKDGRPA